MHRTDERVRIQRERPMTDNTEPNEDSMERHNRRMPDVPLNRNSNPPSGSAKTTANGKSASRRGFLAASAVVGLGAAGMAGPAGADDHDDEDDGDNGEDMDHDEDEDDDDDNDMDGGEFSLQQIVDDPANYYFDVHTENFPGGVVRAQLPDEPGQTEFTLSGDPDAVVDGGNPEASSTVELVLDPHDEVICFDICVTGMTPPYESGANTATHIHEAPEGEGGPPVVVFPDPQPRDPDFEGPRTSSGCLPGVLAFQTGV